MKTQIVKAISNMPKEQVLIILDNIRIIDKRLYKSLIHKLTDWKKILREYRIPFWCRSYRDDVLEEKLTAILKINSILAEKKKNDIPKSDYVLAEEFFRMGKYDEARKYILISAKNGDQRAINLIKLLEKTQKNSFNI